MVIVYIKHKQQYLKYNFITPKNLNSINMKQLNIDVIKLSIFFYHCPCILWLLVYKNIIYNFDSILNPGVLLWLYMSMYLYLDKI